MKKLLLACAVTCVCAGTFAYDLPVFALREMPQAPVVDGAIGAEEWKDAAKHALRIARNWKDVYNGWGIQSSLTPQESVFEKSAGCADEEGKEK